LSTVVTGIGAARWVNPEGKGQKDKLFDLKKSLFSHDSLNKDYEISPRFFRNTQLGFCSV